MTAYTQEQALKTRLLSAISVDFEFVAKLSALIFLLYPSGEIFSVIGNRIACFLILVLPDYHRLAKLWFFVFVLQFLTCIDAYTTLDNHKWLFAYWSFTLFMASLLDMSEQGDYLARMGRLLIGVCMLLAVSYKAFISPDFVNGSFFEFTLMTDKRFGSVAHLFCDAFPSLAEVNERAIAQARSQLSPLVAQVDFQLTSNYLLRRAATVMTWWTLFIETSIGLLFLLPYGGRYLKHILLLVFIVTTYPIAPVIGFASILALMALAHLGNGPIWLRTCYFALIVIFPFFKFTSQFFISHTSQLFK
jgi:hypothetical protein